MSKKTDNTLIIPGADGWELWHGTPEQGFRRTGEASYPRASDIPKIPAGPLFMAFPVREALAIPFQAQTDDAALFDDLAAMHLEKIGVRPEADAGQLTDVFSVGRQDGESTLLNVVLAPPADGTMPSRAPGAFDISARFFPMEPNAVTLWCELGRWVFAVTRDSQLIYFQSLPGTGVTGHAAREVQLALNQLRLQGVSLEIEKAVAWLSGGANDPPDKVADAFSQALGVSIVIEPKPSPILPHPISRLVPADVRAERRMKAARMKRNVVIAAVLLIYLGVASYFGYEYWDLDQQVKKQNAELKSINFKHGDIGVFNDRWDQLAPVVDMNLWPLNVLYRASGQIQRRQDLRFKVFDAKIGHITIRGEAGDARTPNDFAGKLRRALPDYDWNLPPAEPDPKTNRRKFNYEGVLEGSESEL